MDHRERTGEGCFIDVSQAEAGIEFLAPQIAEYCATGRVATANGNRDPAFAPHGVYRAAGDNAWIAIVARDNAEWRRLAKIVGGAQLGNDSRFATLALRKQNEDALDALMSEWVAGRDAHAIEEQLQAEGIPAHVAVASEDFVADPQLHARGHFVRLPHSLMGESVFESARYQLSETPARYERCAPTFGRDNDYVLRELLGYSAERVAELKAAGALT
jgi:crotonobetainyl-CoA:carnitine CoA-transferase CaiB-like acyl-CoA transferase